VGGTEKGSQLEKPPPSSRSHQPQQVLVLEIQDRFGCLFLDFKGSPRACFLFGAFKQMSMALRGVLLGVFIGGWAQKQPPGCAEGHVAADGSSLFAAGLTARHQSQVAVQLLSLLLALQGAFTLLALALRPYISVVLNIIEVACGFLDVAYLAVTMAAYQHTNGAIVTKATRGQDPHLTVRRAWVGLNVRLG
jgi:hypothetical protein